MFYTVGVYMSTSVCKKKLTITTLKYLHQLFKMITPAYKNNTKTSLNAY